MAPILGFLYQGLGDPGPQLLEAGGASKALPTVEDVLDRYVNALGGKDALLKVTSRVSRGTIELPGFGARGRFEVHAKAPNKKATLIEVAGLGQNREGFSGTVGWSSSPTAGVREKNGPELAKVRRESEFHRDLKFRELYRQITVAGREVDQGRSAYVLEAVPREAGSAERFFFDVGSGYLLKQEILLVAGGTTNRVQLSFDDHRVVNGITQPFRVRSSGSPETTFTIQLDEVKLNAPIPDSVFEKPSVRRRSESK
jgi:hypothetical protein